MAVAMPPSLSSCRMHANDHPHVRAAVGLAPHVERGALDDARELCGFEDALEAQVDEVPEAAARDERLGPLGDGTLGPGR
jgi:hypothetical protein